MSKETDFLEYLKELLDDEGYGLLNVRLEPDPGYIYVHKKDGGEFVIRVTEVYS